MKPCLIPLLLLTPLIAAEPPGDMRTRWAADVSAENVWQEYPRPLLRRDEWTRLNGHWDFAVTGREAAKPESWDKILVPFAPESILSGVRRLTEPDEALWYRRGLPGPVEGMRTILHFEAVDYRTSVMVNGIEVGTHTGGHTPFHFDITDALEEEDNELVVHVTDETEKFQLRGKQQLQNGSIWYTRVSGIWQSVWLEHVPPVHISDIACSFDRAASRLTVTPETTSAHPDVETFKMTLSLDNEEIATLTGNSPLVVGVPGAKLWSPDSPTLYDVTVELLDRDGATADRVASYTAFREVGKEQDADGNWRFTLNGEPIFHWGPLDQGWWPDGLLTPPSEEAMLYDIGFLKEAGFNMIRKHIKIEPRRYYYHCDRLGMMVWQDQVSGGPSPRWTRMAPNPEDSDWPDAQHRQWLLEYKRMVDTLDQHPSIVVWTPFNEAWGQHRTMEVGKYAVSLDPTRLINIASGGNFWPVGDIADHHSYPHPEFPVNDERFDPYIKTVGEFGGHGWPVDGHLWDPTRDNWGYGGLPKTLDEWKERYARSISILAGLRKQGVAAGVYTQTTDVEIEINGLLTYDRIRKVDAAWLREQSRILLETPDVVKTETLLPTSESEGMTWSYTFEKPGDGWQSAAFDASSWKTGEGGLGTRETPSTHVRTEWNTSDIWVRRSFEIDEIPDGNLALRIYHDEDAEVYLNGERIAELKGYNGRYENLSIPKETLKQGQNILAIHCHQTEGGQYIDAGLMSESPRN